MLCFSYTEQGLERGISNRDFYCPLLPERFEAASIRLVTGGDWNLSALADAVKENCPHAFLCCLVELIPPTGNKSSLFPSETCLLSIDNRAVDYSPADNSVVFTTEGTKRLYGCPPGRTALRIGEHQIINEDGELRVVDAPPLGDQIDDPYHQYKGQNISVLELL